MRFLWNGSARPSWQKLSHEDQCEIHQVLLLWNGPARSSWPRLSHEAGFQLNAYDEGGKECCVENTPVRERPERGDHRHIEQVRSTQHGQVIGSHHECGIQQECSNGAFQIEDVLLAAEASTGMCDREVRLEATGALVGAATRPRSGSDMGTHRRGESRSGGTERSNSLPVNNRRGLTRGTTQKLRRGIEEATRRPRPFDIAKFWVSSWIILEIFSGRSELTLQANMGCWGSLRPIDVLFGDDSFRRKVQDEALRDIDVWEPDLLSFSPLCGPWSSLNNLTEAEKVAAMRKTHLTFCDFVRRGWDKQDVAGRLVFKEQPATSQSRKLDKMQNRPNLYTTVTHTCVFGLKDPVSDKLYPTVSQEHGA